MFLVFKLKLWISWLAISTSKQDFSHRLNCCSRCPFAQNQLEVYQAHNPLDTFPRNFPA